MSLLVGNAMHRWVVKYIGHDVQMRHQDQSEDAAEVDTGKA